MCTFSATQIAELTAISEDTSYARPWAAFYRAVADMAEGQDGVDPESITWLRTATDVNERVGAESAFIRAYNKLQYTARYGGSISDAAMDDASDDIAGKIFKAIKDNDILPNIHDIALDDAGPTADALFGGDASGWAGNPLFLYLGHSAAFEANIIGPDDEGNPYDALAMLKFFNQANEGAYASSSWGELISAGFATLMQYQQYGILVNSADAQLKAFIDNNYGATPLYDISGFHHSDIILGTIEGSDTLTGTSRDNVIHAGGGDDLIFNSEGINTIDGGEGSDTVDYSAGNFNKGIEVYFFPVPERPINQGNANFVEKVFSDNLNGDESIDILFNIESVIGSNFDDIFHIRGDFIDNMQIDGGEDVSGDTIDLGDAIIGAVVDLGAGTLALGSNSMTIQNFENIIGTAQIDTITGDGQANLIDGGDLGDTIDGGAGTDVLHFAKTGAGVTVDLAAGTGLGGDAQGDTYSNIEVVIGTDGADYFIEFDYPKVAFHGVSLIGGSL